MNPGSNLLPLLVALWCLCFANGAWAQDDVDACALNCVANVNGTNCQQSEWPCLCANNMYIERLNNCTVASCNATDQEVAFSAIAEICAIFSVPVTIGPEATISTPTSNPLFSTVAIPSQSTMPPTTTPISSGAAVTSMSTGGASTSTSSLASSLTTSATSTGLSASPSPSSNDVNRFFSPSELTLILGAGIASLMSIISL